VFKFLSAVVPATLLLGSSFSHAATSYVTASDDTYVRRNNGGPYGSQTTLAVKNRGGNDNTRKAFIGFDGVDAPDAFDVSLSLTLAGLSEASSAKLLVWGINDSTSCGEAFDEATLKYKSSGLSFFADGEDGINQSSACIFGDEPLVSFTVKSSDAGRTFTLSSDALQRFVRANRNGRVTFVITKQGKGNNAYVTFASKEHPTLPAPALSWTSAAELDITGGTVRTNTDGSTHYEGTLKLPLSGGRYLELPGARVDMTFTESGRLETIQGTVGFPELTVAGGLLGGLPLEPTVAGPALQIGFAYGRDLGFTDLPLEDDLRYYYFSTQSGVGVSLGPVEIASDSFGASHFVLEPTAPTILFYSSQIPGLPAPVGAFGVGVSGSNGIPWTPERTTAVAEHMVPFGGDLYLYGELSVPIPAPTSISFDATVSGAVTVNVNDALFSGLNGLDPTGWIEDLGVNGNLDLSASLGAASVTQNVSGATLLYRRHGAHGQPSLTYVGEVAPGSLSIPGFPVSFDGRVSVSGHLDTGSVTSSFMEMRGDVKLGLGFGKVKLDGNVRVQPTKVRYEGKASFAGFRVEVSGDITPSGARLTGDASKSLNLEAGKLEVSLSATLDTDEGVSVRASGRICAAGLGCTGTSVSAKVKSSGHIEVCAVGECKTL
jgi:hypothetical protein